MTRLQKNTPGTTHAFVLSRGYVKIGNHDALVGVNGTKRLFAEICADPDRSDVRPQEAYLSLLTSMQPGWTLRFLQVFWPDPQPRQAFQCQVQNWQVPASEGLDILHQGLLVATEQFPLPFEQRTILEFVFPGEEGIAWWEGLVGLCQGYGVRAFWLGAQDIQEILRRVFAPSIG